MAGEVDDQFSEVTCLRIPLPYRVRAEQLVDFCRPVQAPVTERHRVGALPGDRMGEDHAHVVVKTVGDNRRNVLTIADMSP